MSLFRDLPPPSSQKLLEVEDCENDRAGAAQPVSKRPRTQSTDLPATDNKHSALKGSRQEAEVHSKGGGAQVLDKGGRQVRFKTADELNNDQVVGALTKIAAHIGNVSKFSKASKLALQLLEAGSVGSSNADYFFEVLRLAMTVPRAANGPGVGADYRALFIAANDRAQVFSPAQQAQLAVWLLWADVANELQTDDSYQFSKATGRIRQTIEALPQATLKEDEADLAATSRATESEGQLAYGAGVPELEAKSAKSIAPGGNIKEADAKTLAAADDDPFKLDAIVGDPFGLNDFMPKKSKKEERLRKRKEEEAEQLRLEQDRLRLLRERREAIIHCLQVAAESYKHKWAQTSIDILAKHAFDHMSRFTSRQRDAVDQLWASVRSQQQRRKQGKGIGGKLDVTAFERLQDHYSREAISIRKGVGGGGGRSTTTWLG